MPNPFESTVLRTKKAKKKDKYSKRDFNKYYQTFSVRAMLIMLQNRGEIDPKTWINDPELQYGED